MTSFWCTFAKLEFSTKNLKSPHAAEEEDGVGDLKYFEMRDKVVRTQVFEWATIHHLRMKVNSTTIIGTEGQGSIDDRAEECIPRAKYASQEKHSTNANER